MKGRTKKRLTFALLFLFLSGFFFSGIFFMMTPHKSFGVGVTVFLSSFILLIIASLFLVVSSDTPGGP